MIIKKWSTSTTEWIDQVVETTARGIRTGVDKYGSTTEADYMFDTNNKLKVAYMPDAVVGGMKFVNSFSLSGGKTVDELLAVIDELGEYVIVSVGGDLVAGSIATGATVTAPGDEGDNLFPITLEAGDWIVYTGGSGISPQFSIINNTYQTMTSSAYGVAKVGYTTSGQNYKVDISSGNLFVNVPWQNTTYSPGTGLSLNGTTFNHSNSITAGTASEGGVARTLAYGGSFNIPSITYDAQGHITSKGSIALTLPASVDTTYSQYATSTTGGAILRMLDSNSVTDDISFVRATTSTTMSISATDVNTITFTDNYPVYHGDTLPTTNIANNAIGFEW